METGAGSTSRARYSLLSRLILRTEASSTLSIREFSSIGGPMLVVGLVHIIRLGCGQALHGKLSDDLRLVCPD